MLKIVLFILENNIDLEAIWSMKDSNLTAAWLASNCKTSNHRMELIKNARKKGLQVGSLSDSLIAFFRWISMVVVADK